MQPTNNHPLHNHSDNNFDDDGLSVKTLESEVQEVQTSLIAATGDLPTPLGDLVRAQIRRSQPLLCGAVVLVVSKPPSGTHDNGDFHHKRILLASALEMLHVALNVHRLLVNAARTEQGTQNGGSEAELDRAFIGSTILAGDYCFSRAAQMAAQTDNPRVVSTFSLALQGVSEGLLREQFSPRSEQLHILNVLLVVIASIASATSLSSAGSRRKLTLECP